MLARALATRGHAVRATTRRANRAPEILATGAEPVVADPDRLGTLMGALDHVSVAVILLGSADSPPRVILITSPLPQEGKTTTTVNSAVSLAQQGHKVLLVDADLRRPAVHLAFGLKPESGLSDVLAGRHSLDKALIESTLVPNLTILPAGTIPPHPSELLASDTMAQLIARWSTEYDHVVIDSPPMLTVTDAVLLSARVERVVIVVRAGRTTKSALRRSRELLAHVNASVLGVVLNGIDVRSPDHYHYYYSGTKYYGGYYHE